MSTGNPISGAGIAAAAAIAGGLVGGITSGIWQSFLDWLNQPKLHLDFDENRDRSEVSWDGQHPFDGVLARISLQNRGKRTAHGCRIFVKSIQAVQTSGKTGTAFRDSRQLPWAGWNFDAIAVPSYVTFYLDLIRVDKHSPGWQLTFQRRMASDKELEAFRGTYSFCLVAVAENAKPFQVEVHARYEGDWHQFTMWKPQA